MEIQHIREFVTLENQRNYLAAAEELFISQSTLSKHIISLEKELGFSLFERTTRRVQLSPPGRLFLPYAKQILKADEEFRQKAAAMNRTDKDCIHLGVLPAFISYHMEYAIMDFKKQHPQYHITLTEGSNSALMESLRDGGSDIVMVRSYESCFPRDMEAVPLLRDRICLITIPGKLFGPERTHVTWKELEQAELLTSTSEQQARVLSAFAEENGIHFNIISKLSRWPSIIEMLRKGMGNAALLNKIPSSQFDSEKDFRILEIDPPIYNTVSLVYSKERPMTAATRSFLDTVVPFIQKAAGEDYHV